MSRTALLIGTVAGLALVACRENPTETVSAPLRPSLSVAQSTSSPVVNSTADDGDGTCTDTKCTLRDAIVNADAGATITFNLDPGALITLNSTKGQLIVTKNLTIAGPGPLSGTTVRSLSTQHRIFFVSGGAVVTISGLRIQGGGSNVGGGVVVVVATLTIDQAVISGNRATEGGGGIAVNHLNGTLVLTRSTVAGNSTSGRGGGILNRGTLTVINSTIAGNVSAGGSDSECGGGIANEGVATVSHSTIASNGLSTLGGSTCGGGIASSNTPNPAASLTLSNSIVADNSHPNCSGNRIVDGGFNLDDLTTCGFSESNHSLSWQDPALALTGDLYAIPGSSAASNKIPPGSNGCGTTYLIDQRGVARPQHGSCDIGSYEFQDNTNPAVTLTTPAHGGSYQMGSSLTADYSCEDLESWIASCVGTEADGDPIDTSILGSHTFLVTAIDYFGNSTTTTATYTVFDHTAPIIQVFTPTFGATYGLNQVVLANYSCLDSGLASCNGTVPNGSPINTASPGSHSFTVTARDMTGNISTPVTRHYTVVGYTFQGFAAPVDNNGTLNVAKAGKTIPLKWRLVDANGAGVTTLASVTATAADLPCGLVATADAVEEYSAGSSGLQNLGDGYYQYNWKAPASYANSCKTLMLDLGDGSPRTAAFQFTK